MGRIIPFGFQIGLKDTGCEDAPPIASDNPCFSIVCDGLGGSGGSMHPVIEDGQFVQRTSAYLGSRIVCNATESYFRQETSALLASFENGSGAEVLQAYVLGLKQHILRSLEEKMEEWNIAPKVSRTMRVFPTTLTSVICLPSSDGFTAVAIWAGDSRVYALTPKNGLQLLSLDDAEGAENNMGSSTRMTNCISADSAFYINYATYAFQEPVILFCCSDGCTDYLPSPLNFEWLLQEIILNPAYLPDCEGDDLGSEFARSIQQHIYGNIYDDTTMAGLIIGIETTGQMRELFQPRRDIMGKQAEDMNHYLLEQRNLSSEQENARKTLSLRECAVKNEIDQAIAKAMNSEETNPCLRACLLESSETAELCNLQAQCKILIQLDYFLNRRTRLGIGLHRNCPEIQDVMHQLKMCIKMYEHPCLKDIELSLGTSEGWEQDSRLQIRSLNTVYRFLSCHKEDALFSELWLQVFTMLQARKKIEESSRDPVFIKEYERAMENPESVSFLSNVTRKLIRKYKDSCGGAERNEVVECREKILLDLQTKSEEYIRRCFEGTSVSIDELLEFLGAASLFKDYETRIETAKQAVNEIWENYRKEYQWFKNADERGCC